MIPKSVPSNLRSRIEFWDDERSIGNSLIITLKDGWAFRPAEHVEGFDTVRDAVAGMKSTVRCSCPECSK